jgi:choline dehydrogenase
MNTPPARPTATPIDTPTAATLSNSSVDDSKVHDNGEVLENHSSANPYDYLIIGAGTAGALLANRLSAKHSVLLIEAGKTDEYLWIHVPVGYLYCISNPRTDWMYHTQPTAGLNGRSLIYPRGKVLGGCSSINGMIYMRGQSHNYDAWAAAGNRGWAWADCLPAFKQHEAYHGGADDFHGAKGEWTVSKQRLQWPVLESFKAAAIQYGLPDTPDFNRGDNTGVGYFEVNQRGGWRLNTAKAFLRPIFARQTLQVYVNSPVQKLLFDDAADPKRCTGVVVEHGGELQTLRPNKEVILCAGAVASPAILERSGVGQAARLQALGIPVVHHLAGVGENLQDHLQIRCAYKVTGVSTLNTLAAHWWGKAWIGLQYLFTRSGPMSMAPSQLGAFAHSDPSRSPDQPHANVQFHVQPLSLEAFGQPLHSFDAMTVSVCNLQPTSRGSVHIRDTNMHTPPDIQPNYLATAADQTVAADSIRLARKMMAQAAMHPYSPEEFKPGVQFQTDAQLIKAAGDIASTIFHPVGTCKMGVASDAMAVVNDRLQVHGLKNLRVVDASIMPTITSGNTNAPTLMIAEKAAAWMLAGE